MRCRLVDSNYNLDSRWFVGELYEYRIKYVDVCLYQYEIDLCAYNDEIITYGFYDFEFSRWFVDISVERDRKIREVLGEV